MISDDDIALYLLSTNMSQGYIFGYGRLIKITNQAKVLFDGKVVEGIYCPEGLLENDCHIMNSDFGVPLFTKNQSKYYDFKLDITNKNKKDKVMFQCNDIREQYLPKDFTY